MWLQLSFMWSDYNGYSDEYKSELYMMSYFYKKQNHNHSTLYKHDYGNPFNIT